MDYGLNSKDSGFWPRFGNTVAPWTEDKPLGRKRKSEVLPPSYRAHRAMPLNTPGDALREMGRIYRASCNGHLATEEMTRFMYALDKIRSRGGGRCTDHRRRRW